MCHIINILLVEDNEGDIVLAMEALKEAKVANIINVTRDGEEALNYLHQRGVHASAILPDLILLDLNLPGIDGMEVLAEINIHEKLRTIPVVILTTSSDEDDILASCNKHASCFMTKPVDLEMFIKIVHKIENFWLTIVKNSN